MADKLLSIRAYADQRGVSDMAVRKAIKAGRIGVTEDGMINKQYADRQWDANTNPAQSPTIPDENKAAVSFQKSRAQKELYDALLKKLEYEKQAGAMIPLKQTETDAFNAARFARDMLLKIPDRVANVLIGKTDMVEIKQILRNEILESLEHLTDFLNGPEL